MNARGGEDERHAAAMRDVCDALAISDTSGDGCSRFADDY